MPEEQRVSTEVSEVSPTEGNTLMGQYHLGKAMGLQAQQSLLLLLCLYMFAGSLSMLSNMV